MSLESFIGAIHIPAQIRTQLANKITDTSTSQVYLLQSDKSIIKPSPALPSPPDKKNIRLKSGIISIINHSYRFNVKISAQDISIYKSKNGKDATIKIVVRGGDLEITKNIANYLESRIGTNYNFEIDSTDQTFQNDPK